MTVPPAMLTASGVVGALGLAAAAIAIRRGGGIGWTLGVLAALVAIAGLGFLVFGIWGRNAGMPWDFAPLVAQ